MPTANMMVQTYLVFGGRCAEALDFYGKALGAKVEMMMRFSDSPEPTGMPEGFGEKIMHATMRIGDAIVMFSDGRCDGVTKFEGFSMSITVPDEAEADRVFAALGEGGQVMMPLAKTFWAPKFGMLTDRFGVPWMVSVTHKP